MKIKVINKTYNEVINTKPKKLKKPIKPNIFWRTLIKVISAVSLKFVHFKYNKDIQKQISKKEPSLILMNHSSFVDLQIAEHILYPRVFNIVCTNDGFVGKNWLLRQIGCINTPKFIVDQTLVRKLLSQVKKKSSILMYPEASYSFDGTMTPLPYSLPKLVRLLKIDVVTIITNGAFLIQPLYNELKKRKVDISAKVKVIIKKEEIDNLSDEDIYNRINTEFSFDNFSIQQQNKIKITEPFRAEGLNKVLYKCPHCMTEGKMTTSGTKINCNKCNVTYELDEYGYLNAINAETIFNHIPDWYKWEREKVKEELVNNTYQLDVDCDIYMMIDTYKLYNIGSGHLVHNNEGFTLTNDKDLDFKLNPLQSYSLYSDFYWYQIADVICIGDYKKQFYCFPKDKNDVVAKTRLATEELYKLSKSK